MRLSQILLYALSFLPSTGLANEANHQKVKAMYADIQAQFMVPEISIEELKALAGASDFVLVDVRELREREVSVIPDALSQTQFEASTEKHKSKKIVVYCTIGYRSAQYVQKLRQQGLEAYNLEESLLGWSHKERRLVDLKGSATQSIHVYGSKWNLPPDGFKAVW